jgi:signal peptidase I
MILFGATLLALAIRVFLFESIRVASPAMSESQKAGDRLFIEKWSLGARLPMSVGFPFAPEVLFGRLTYVTFGKEVKRCPALGTIERDDLLAFNDPDSKKVLDRSPILLSRCVGLPGEHFRLSKGKCYINGKKVKRPADVSYCYSFPLQLQGSLQKVMKAYHFVRPIYHDKDSGFVYLTRYEWLCLYRIRKQIDLKLRVRFTSFDEKDLRIPSKGLKIELNDKTFQLYGETINRFENAGLTIDTAGNILKNGHKVRFHTFKENYYFLVNDHQGFLNDSRRFGLLPEHLIIGKAWMVFLSPSNKRFLEKI